MNAPSIVTIRLPIANAYLIKSRRPILVDTGAPGDEGRILRALAAQGLRPGDLGLILLTHGHVDHFGSAAALKRATGAPLAVHADDAAGLRAGHIPSPLSATGLEGRLLRPFLPWSAEPVAPDLLLDERFDLSAYGVDGRLLHTPGHSPGSISLLLSSGDLFAGDLLRGGFMGGRLRGRLPNLPFYVDQPALLARSIAQILDLPATTIYVGHGGPLSAAAARRRMRAGAFAMGARHQAGALP